MILWLFYHLRLGIMALRKQWCRVADHKMEWTGYYEPAAHGGNMWLKVGQCVRCRMIERQNPDAPCVRFDMKNPYGK